MVCYSIMCWVLVVFTLFVNSGAFEQFVGNESPFVPYQVSIQIFDPYFQEWCHICGGSIIATDHVLTAAYCLQHTADVDHRIVAGTWSHHIQFSVHNIAAVKAHPNSTDFYGSDIAVVKVSPNFKFNKETIDKIAFESYELVPGNVPAIYSGWKGSGCGISSLVLDVENFLTWSNAECLPVFPNIASTEICAIANRICGTDFGGPLVDEERNLQIGVAIYGTRNVTAFTRVSAFVDWIQKEIAN